MASDNTTAARRQLKIKAGVVKRWVNGSDHTIPWLESDKIIVSPALPALYTRFFISLTLLFFSLSKLYTNLGIPLLHSGCVTFIFGLLMPCVVCLRRTQTRQRTEVVCTGKSGSEIKGG